MPNVNGQQFPYTPQGMRAAQQASQMRPPPGSRPRPQSMPRPGPPPGQAPAFGQSPGPQGPRGGAVPGGGLPRSNQLSQAPRFAGGGPPVGPTGPGPTGTPRRQQPQGGGPPGVQRPGGGGPQPMKVGPPMGFPGGMGDTPGAMALGAVPGVGRPGTMNSKWQQSAGKWGQG